MDKKQSIQRKLVMFVVLIIGISNMLFAVISGLSTITRIRNKTEQIYLASAESTAREMSDWFDKQVLTVDSLVEALGAGTMTQRCFRRARIIL